jgi:hypothetical protein
MVKRTLGSSRRAGVMGAVLIGLPAYFLMVIDALPAVSGAGGLVIVGRLVVAGTIATGLVLVTQTRTRRFGLELLLGSVVMFALAFATAFVFVLYAASTIGS